MTQTLVPTVWKQIRYRVFLSPMIQKLRLSPVGVLLVLFKASSRGTSTIGRVARSKKMLKFLQLVVRDLTQT